MATYAQVQAVLLNRLGKYLTEAEVTNLEPCISWGIRQSGGTTLNLHDVQLGEVGTVTDVDMLLD